METLLSKVFIGSYESGITNLDGKLLSQVNKPTYGVYAHDAVVTTFQDECGCGIMVLDTEFEPIRKIYSDETKVSCHVLKSDSLVVTCNYHNHKIYIYQNYELVQIIDHKLDHSHPHCSLINNQLLYVFDLGLDTIFVYNLSDYSLSDTIKFKPKTGIRHGIFEGDILYAVSEYSGEVFKIENNLIVKQVNVGSDTYNQSGSAIRLYRDFVVVANRRDNVITVLKKENLEIVNQFSCLGDHPRDFNIVNDLLVCANMNSNEVVLFDLKQQDCVGRFCSHLPCLVMIDK